MTSNLHIMIDQSSVDEVAELLGFTVPLTDELRRELFVFLSGVRFRAAFTATQPTTASS